MHLFQQLCGLVQSWLSHWKSQTSGYPDEQDWFFFSNSLGESNPDSLVGNLKILDILDKRVGIFFSNVPGDFNLAFLIGNFKILDMRAEIA